MEEVFSSDKENVIGHINCSPVLLERNIVKKRISSPFLPLRLQESQKENIFENNSPELPTFGREKVLNKANIQFLSTPLRPSAPKQVPQSKSWEDIRKLDEEEAWVERTQVVTKEDHSLYFEVAKEVVNSIIENLSIHRMENIDNTQLLDIEQEENTGNDTVVFDEKKEELSSDVRIVTMNENEQLDQTLGKSVLEDNDFIHSCSNLNETVKEILEDEEPISPKKFDDIPTDDTDVDKTICENIDVKLADPLPTSQAAEVSDLDETLKEILEDEEPISPKKFDDIPTDDTDVDKTICENIDVKLADPLPISQAAQVSAFDVEKIEDTGTFDAKISEDPLGPVEDPDFEINFDEDSFRPAAGAAFALELDYLENLSQSDDTEHLSDLARQSLYVKFDPLVQAGNKSQQNTALPALAQANPADYIFPGAISGSDLLLMDTPPKKPTKSRVLVLPEATSEQQKSNEIPQEITPVDQLFEFSPEQKASTCNSEKSALIYDIPKYNGNELKDESSLVQPLLYSKSDLDKAVLDERNRLTTQWKEESAFSELEIKELTAKLRKSTLENEKALAEIHEMKAVMSEYEQTMAQMIEDREKDKCSHAKANSEILQERDQFQHDLHNTEKSFAHLHTRFEKLKNALEGYRKNEEILKKAVKDLQESNKKSEGNYQALKKHAEEKLHDANAEVSRLQASNKNEVAVLQATLKRERSKNSSLQQNLDQKINENKELTAICDELISKVGPLQ